MPTSGRHKPAAEPRAIQTQILEQLTELKGKVEEGLVQGRENSNELKLIRKELGLDGPHGRLPIVEATLIRHDSRMDKMQVTIDGLEMLRSEAEGKHKMVTAMMALLGGGTGGAIITLFGHILGLR